MGRRCLYILEDAERKNSEYGGSAANVFLSNSHVANHFWRLHTSYESRENDDLDVE